MLKLVISIKFWSFLVPSIEENQFCSDPVVNTVLASYINRSNVGIKTYGVTMDENRIPKLEWLNHLQEELMDGTLYLERLKRALTETGEFSFSYYQGRVSQLEVSDQVEDALAIAAQALTEIIDKGPRSKDLKKDLPDLVDGILGALALLCSAHGVSLQEAAGTVTFPERSER